MAESPYSDRQRLAETEMTIGDLKHLIEEIVSHASTFSHPASQPQRPVHEVLASMRRNLWTPPPGTASNAELLRGDRDK